jgi:hypothetical protein
MRDSFIIYRSFYEAICDIDNDSQAQVFKAICEYCLNFQEPELQGIAKTIFKLIKPQLDANNKKYENGKLGAEHGKKGGRPKPQDNPKETPKKPQDNPKETPKKPQDNPKETPNVNVNVNVNDNLNVNENENYNENEKINKKDLIFSFEDFWNLYPNKVAKDKCKEKYYRLSVTEIEKIKNTISTFVKYKPFESYNHPNPETYLNQKRWNDELKKSDNYQNKSDAKIQDDPNKPGYGKTWEEMTDQERHKNKGLAVGDQLKLHNAKMETYEF